MSYDFFNNATKIKKPPNTEIGKTKEAPIFKILEVVSKPSIGLKVKTD
jgi:hypothetical protein